MRLIICLLLIPMCAVSQVPKVSQELITKLESWEAEEQAQLNKKIEEKRKLVVSVLQGHLQETTKSGNLEGALAIKEEVERLQKPLGAEGSDRTSTNLSNRSSEQPAIPKDAHRNRTSYYLWVDKQVSWEVAVEECKKMGGHLVTVSSEKEWEDIIAYRDKAGKKGKRFWIGLSRAGGPEVPLSWLDNTEMKFTNWKENQPRPEKKQPLGVQVSSGGGWYAYHQDNKSSGTHGFICEWPHE